MVIEVIAVLICALVIALPFTWFWTRLSPVPSKRAKWFRVGTCWSTAVVVTVMIALRIIDSRNFQIVGGLVPRVSTESRTIALTFDDGPVPGATDESLRILAREEVTATFFLNGNSISQHPVEARKIMEAGHEIGNHSYSHARLVGRSLSYVRSEITRTDERILEMGYRGPIRFRPPYGKKFLVLPYYLWRTNRLSVTWDIEPDSYSEVAKTSDRIVAHVLDRAQPGSVILLHIMFPSRRTSLEAVPSIITGLKAQGYRFATVSELVSLDKAEGAQH